MQDAEFPKSLLQAARYAPDLDVCVEFVASLRWMDGTICRIAKARSIHISRVGAFGSA